MITIVPYDRQFDPALRAGAPAKFRELTTHGDVLPDSAVCAVEDGRLLGFGYLLADEDFRRPAEEAGSECHLGLEFQALPDAGEQEPEVCAKLLKALLDFFDALRDKLPEKEPILRTWCGAGKTAYMDFLLSYGFYAARPMLVYVRELAEKTSNSENNLTEIKETALEDPREFSTFLSTMERAFETPESAANLRYRLADPGTRVFAAYRGGEIIGGMVTWKTGKNAASTEYIFCDPDWQRTGVAEKLLRHAFAALGESGVTHVLLTVHGDNLPAIALYQKTGYELRSALIEMHYI